MLFDCDSGGCDQQMRAVQSVTLAIHLQNNALAITFKSSVDIALKYVKEKFVGLAVLCSSRNAHVLSPRTDLF